MKLSKQVKVRAIRQASACRGGWTRCSKLNQGLDASVAKIELGDFFLWLQEGEGGIQYETDHPLGIISTILPDYPKL